MQGGEQPQLVQSASSSSPSSFLPSARHLRHLQAQQASPHRQDQKQAQRNPVISFFLLHHYHSSSSSSILELSLFLFSLAPERPRSRQSISFHILHLRILPTPTQTSQRSIIDARRGRLVRLARQPPCSPVRSPFRPRPAYLGWSHLLVCQSSYHPDSRFLPGGR